MKRPLAIASAFLAALALITALCFFALRFPAAQTIDVGAPGDAFFLANFYRPEADSVTYRWSAPGARLLINGAYHGALALTLRLHSPGFAQPDARRLEIARAGQPAAELPTLPEWRVYRILLPPASEAGSPQGQLPLDLITPAVPPGPGDPRPLGVALDLVVLQPVRPDAAPLGPPLRRALLLAWACGLLACVPLLLMRAGSQDAQGRTPGDTFLMRVCGLMILAGAGLALWAWRDPGGFAWAVPTIPLWVLVAGSLALGLRSAGARYGVAVRTHVTKNGVPAAWWALGSLLLGHALLLAPLPWRGLGALLLLGLPGTLAALVLFPDEDEPFTRLLLGLCGAIAVAPLLLLALHALPGPLPAALLLASADLLCLAMLGLLWRAGPPTPEQREHKARLPVAVSLVLIGGIALRLALLGGAEFQGDEARAMLLALGVAMGDDSILLTHTKGPVEALLPAGPIVLAGAASEWVARLPFAVAGVGLLLAAIVLIRAMGAGGAVEAGGTAAAVAVGLLATDGFALGFARIVQYQSVVMLMSAGAFWCCWRFHQGAARPARYLIGAAFVLAVGLLAHYDAIMVVPALAWLVIAGGVRRGWRGVGWLRGLAWPAFLGGALLASFYLPYVRGESFAATAAYLGGRAGQGDNGGPPFNNLPLYANVLAFYNAPPLVPALAAALLLAIATLLVRAVRPRIWGWLAAVVLVVAASTQGIRSQLFALPGGANWAGLAFGLPLAALCLFPAVPAPVRALAIWFSVPFLAEAFAIAEPRTHFYTAHVAAALLVGTALAYLLGPTGDPASRWRRRPSLQAALAFVGVLWLAAGALYAQLVFLRQFPEYQRAFPAARPAVLRAPYGDSLPEAGYFGFPHRDGWKAAAELRRAGLITGSYDTNQNRWLAGWYMGNAPRCAQTPDYYLIAEAEASQYFPPGYALVGEVTVGQRRALAIYSRAPFSGPPHIYSAAELAARFDARALEPFPVAPILADLPRAECAS